MGKIETKKKEKGTKNSTQDQDSVKNQVKFTEKYFKNKQISIVLIDKLILKIAKDLTIVTNDLEYKRIEDYKKLAKRVRECILNDPRYPHQKAQWKIDNSYGGSNFDPNIKGAKVHLIFSKIKNDPNYIPHVEPIF